MKKQTIILLAALLAACSVRGQQTYHILDIIPNQAGSTIGEIRFYETTDWGSGSTVHYIGLKAPASIASNFALTLPAALPASTTRCLEATTAGVIQYASAACGTGGGGGFYQTVQEAGTARTQRAALNFLSPFTATDDSGSNRTNIAMTTSPSGSPVGTGRTISTTSPITGGGDLSANRTIACATCVTTNTTQTITGAKTFTGTTEFDGLARIDNGVEIRNSSGIVGGKFESTASNILDLRNSAGTLITRWNSTGSPLVITIGTSGSEVRSAGTLLPSGTVALGSSGARWAGIWGTTANLSGAVTAGSTLAVTGVATFSNNIVPATTLSRTLGTTSARWGNLYTSNVELGVASTVTGLINFYRLAGAGASPLRGATRSSGTAVEADNFAISSSGSFYTRSFSGGDVACGSTDNGWLGIRTDIHEAQFCSGNTTRTIPSVPAANTPASATCGSGVASLTVVNGIITAITCI